MILNISRQDIEKFDTHYRVNFINSLSGLKSLFLIGTKSENGQENLAVFNSITHIGASPPLLGIVFRPDSVPRHTLRNIRKTQDFTLNLVSQDIYQKAHQTSARYSESEFLATDLTPEYRQDFTAPFCQESPLTMAMRLQEEVAIKTNGTYLIVGEILTVSLNKESVSDDGFIDLYSHQAIAGGSIDAYYPINSPTRLSYAKPNKKIEEI